jgi:predicted GNAT family N-acyltransferase
MSNSPAFGVRRVEWAAASQQLREVRTSVFVVEQRIPENLEWDDMDAHCIHVLAIAADGSAIGTGRLLPDGHIGRMAVLRPWRGKGVGAALLRELLAAASEQGHAGVELSAQTHAIGFYQRFGFEVSSEEYPEVDIPHRAMRLMLD